LNQLLIMFEDDGYIRRIGPRWILICRRHCPVVEKSREAFAESLSEECFVVEGTGIGMAVAGASRSGQRLFDYTLQELRRIGYHESWALFDSTLFAAWCALKPGRYVFSGREPCETFAGGRYGAMKARMLSGSCT
jgi:hypothetical protein